MPPGQNVSAPFSFAPSQSWDGNAGSWSTFILRIGTPPQDFKVLPSTNGHQIWVPVPLGCTSTDPLDCGALRGALPFRGASSNGFLSNESSSWVGNGIYNLGIENHINLTGNGDYGYDTVGLESENSGGPTLTHQVVAGIATKDFYLGQFGLDPRPSNFTTNDAPIPGYLRNLVDSKLIPSFSYGYTAGAKYRLNGVFGSLIFGGYDSSRLTLSNFTVPFSADDSRSLTIGVQSITASNSLQGSVDLLPAGAFYLIDSSVPDLWLPETACRLFEEAFGLTFDYTTNLYLVNDTIHSHLLQLNPTVSLKLGIQPFNGPNVNITLPYGAFDLQASSPFYPNATNYFPLRRAANSTQFTLGRTFLQEAYIIVDNERSNFSVNQAVFRDPSPEALVTIYPKSNTSSESTSHHHSLDRGAIAGITVGTVAFFVAVIAITVILIRRHHRTKRPPSVSELANPEMQDADGSAGSPRLWFSELDPKGDARRDPQELSSTPIPVPRHELRGSSAASEMPSPGIPEVKDSPS